MNHSTHRTAPAARTRLATVVLLLATAAAACGSDPAAGQEVASLATDGTATDGTATDGTATDGTTPVDPEDAMLEYAQCMREHGVDMPDPQMDDSGAGVIVMSGTASVDDVPTGTGVIGPDPAFDAAFEACQPIMDAVVGDVEIDPEVLAEQREQMLDFAQCMRDHGIDMPDPVFDDNGGISVQVGGPGEPGDGAASGPSDDDWQAANEACGELLGGPGIPSIAVGTEDPDDGNPDGGASSGIVVGGGGGEG